MKVDVLKDNAGLPVARPVKIVSSNRLWKGALVATLSAVYIIAASWCLLSPDLVADEVIPAGNEFTHNFDNYQARHLAQEHHRLRKRRYNPYARQQQRKERNLKLLQRDFVDCSQYQYTQSISDKLRINYVVDVDQSNPGNGTFKAEVVYQGQAWLGFAHSEQGSMVGSIGIIGLPDAPPTDHQVQKYRLAGTDLDGIQPLLPEHQTLLDTSLEQTENRTVMRFTKLLSESAELAELPIHPTSQNTFLFAVGGSNELGLHESRGVVVLDLTPCLPSRRGFDVMRPGDNRIEQDVAEDRMQASNNYVITFGTELGAGDPPPILPLEYKNAVPQEKPQGQDPKDDPQQFDIPDQFTADDDYLKLPLSLTHPTMGIKIWWTLHGFFSMLTCGVLLPIVIASSMLQGCCGSGKKRPKFPNNQIHRWSTLLLLLSILATFITALVGAAKDTARNDDSLDEIQVTYVDVVVPVPKGPKPESYHRPAGLALFIFFLFFALTGNLRSYLTTAGLCSPSKEGDQDQENDQKDEDDKESDSFNSDTAKSTVDPGLANIARRWDQGHCFVGVVLLFVSWWQCQSGLDVFEYRFFDSWFTKTLFWSISGTCAGILGFACILQLVSA